ncbi:MAG TPA: hypothetical protein PLA50_20425, partial [Bacteroidia bacterium]|nr:hypothetical protein [Bacteroidia bacterium]
MICSLSAAVLLGGCDSRKEESDAAQREVERLKAELAQRDQELLDRENAWRQAELDRQEAALYAAQQTLEAEARHLETMRNLDEAERRASEQRIVEERAALEEERRQMQANQARQKAEADRLARQEAENQRKATEFARAESERRARARSQDLDFFYDHLKPHGNWYETSDYGYVWSPSGVSRDWRPYSEGRWVWTETGWTWESYEPYGWAVYHYG